MLDSLARVYIESEASFDARRVGRASTAADPTTPPVSARRRSKPVTTTNTVVTTPHHHHRQTDLSHVKLYCPSIHAHVCSTHSAPAKASRRRESLDY